MIDRSEVQKEMDDKIKQADSAFAVRNYAEAARFYLEVVSAANAHNFPEYYRYNDNLQLAKDLISWTKNVSKAIADAEIDIQSEKAKKAYDALNDLLKNIPSAEPYVDLRQRAEKACAVAQEALGDEGMYQKALEAEQNGDYEEAIRSAQSIPKVSLRYDSAQTMIKRAQDRLFRQRSFLEAAEIALNEKRWNDVFFELERFKAQFPNSQLWREYWRAAGAKGGKEERDAGDASLVAEEFAAARRHFSNAKNAQLKIKEAYSTYFDAQNQIEELSDLESLTSWAQKAKEYLSASQFHDARNELLTAQTRLADAKQKGHDYPVMDARIAAMLERTNEAIRAANAAEAALQTAEQALKDHDLQTAEDNFKIAAQSSKPDIQTRAQQGQAEVGQEKRRFAETASAGDRSNNPVEAAKQYKEALSIWRDHPETKKRLVKARESALIAAEQNKKQSDVSRLARELLEVAPDNSLARTILDRLDIEPLVTGLADSTKALLGQEKIDSKVLISIENEIEMLLPKTVNQPQLRARLNSVLEEIRRLLETMQKAEAAVQAAEAQIQEEDWVGGVAAYQTALDMLGARAPTNWRERLVQLRFAEQAVQAARKAAPPALESAQKAYAECFERDTLAEIEVALNTAEKALKNAADAVESVPAQLPEDLAGLHKEANDLRKRFGLVRDTRQTNEPRTALQKLHGGVQSLGGEVDPVLTKFLHDLEEKLKAEIPQIISEAHAAAERGRFNDASENLRLAREIDSRNDKIAKEQSRLTELKNLYDESSRTRANAESKSDSPTEKQKALKEGLNVFCLAPPELVGEELSEKIAQLLRLGDDAVTLTDSKNYDRAKKLIDDFRKAPGVPHWALREALGFADDWLKLVQKNAQEGVRESAAAVGDLLGAYRAATQLVVSDPTNERYLKTRLIAQEALVKKQTQSAQKRYDWAQVAFTEGEFASALSDLAAIEEQFFKPAEAEFPNVFEVDDGISGVEAIRKNIHSLQHEIEKAQKVKEVAQPILDAARELFSKNQFATAEEKLDELERHDLDPAARAWKESAALRAKIQKAHAQAETKKLGSLVTEKESAFSMAALLEHYVDLLQQLNDAPQTIDFSVIPAEAEEKKRYEDLRAKITTGLTNYRQHEQHMRVGKEALAKEEYEKAADAFREAIGTAPDASSRMTAEIELKKIEERGKAQSALKAALEKAHQLLSGEQYEAAHTEFENIFDFGAEWETVATQGAELARAGRWYLQAKANAEAVRLDEAQTALKTAGALADTDKWQELKASDNYAARRRSAARTIKEKIDVLSGNIQRRTQSEKEKQQEQAQAMRQAEAALQARRVKLLQAQEELVQGRYLPAKQMAEEVLLGDPHSSEAKSVWDDAVKGLAQEEMRKREEETRKKLQEAAKALTHKEYPQAEAIADEVLRADPSNPDAKAISHLVAVNRLHDAGRAGDAIVEAEKIAQDKISIPDIEVAIRSFKSSLSDEARQEFEERDQRRKEELNKTARKAEAERAQKSSALTNEVISLQAAWKLSAAAAQLRTVEELAQTPSERGTLEELKAKQAELERKDNMGKPHLDVYYGASAWGDKIDALKRARAVAPDHPEVVKAVTQSYDQLIADGKSALAKNLFAEAKLLGKYAQDLRNSVESAELIRDADAGLKGYLDERRKSAWRALKYWNLEAAEKYRDEILAQDSNDASLHKLEKRAAEILEKAKPTHDALKEAWGALRTADFVAAQGIFEVAKRRASDEDMLEIDTWHKFTSEFQFAREYFQKEEFENARNALQTAAKSIAPVKNELPSVFGGINAIFALRQSARECAEQALQIVVEIIRNYNEWKRLESFGDEDGALRCIREIKSLKESFVQSLNLSLRMSSSASKDEKAYEEKGDGKGNADGQKRKDEDAYDGKGNADRQEQKDEDAYEESSDDFSDAQGIGLAAFSAATPHKVDEADDDVPMQSIAPLPPDEPDTLIAPPSRVLPPYDKSVAFSPSEEPEKPASPQIPPDKDSDSTASSSFPWVAPKLTSYEE